MFDDATLTVMAQAAAARITHISLHTSGAVTSSASESAAARKPVTWAVDGDGDLTAGPFAFAGGTASGPVVRVGYWTAATGGTYCGGAMLPAGQQFDASGAYTVDSITETGTAS